MDVDVDPDKTNPFGEGTSNTGGDDAGESLTMEEREKASSRRGSEDITDPFRDKTRDETSFIEGIDEHTPLIRRESSMDEAWGIIHKKFPQVDTSDPTFTATLNKKGRVMVRLVTEDGKPYDLFKLNGELRKGLPKGILRRLGPTAEEVVEANEEENSSERAEVSELKSKLETAPENQKESIRHQITEREDRIGGRERVIEETEQRMSLRDRIKAIFKKYGFTLIGALAAVGTVIGVIVSNLKQGLTTLGKGVGSGLKSIGKKLGEILPGLVGAIASFVFKTAGEVIGFLGKNAWLLIVGVVIFLIERLKKTTR